MSTRPSIFVELSMNTQQAFLRKSPNILMPNTPLFRKEVLELIQTKWLGTITLVSPISFFLLTLFSLLLNVAVVAFSAHGTYTKHSTVIGKLIPDTGLIKMYPTQLKVISQKLVKESQQFQ